MRRIFSICVQDETFVGTLQAPDAACHSAPDNGSRSGTSAVLFLSFGQAPRAGLGDSEAFVADRLIEQGYLVLRMDSPGLGEAPGNLPEDIRSFWRSVEVASQQSMMRELVTQIAKKFSIDTLLVGGLCAGAINAVYAADPPHPCIRGLVLLELPLFETPPLEGPPGTRPPVPPSGPARRLTSRARHILSSASQRARRAIRNSRLRGPCHAAADLLRRSANRLTGGKLPPNANHRLIAAFHRVADTALPILMCCAEPVKDELTLRSILRRHRHGSIRLATLPGTNHMMNTVAGKHGAAEQITKWLQDLFPLHAARSVWPEPRLGHSHAPTPADEPQVSSPDSAGRLSAIAQPAATRIREDVTNDQFTRPAGGRTGRQ